MSSWSVIDRELQKISCVRMGKRRERINEELELIQTLAHLLQKAGESDAEVTINGWAMENAGKMILNAACEVREALEEEIRK